MMDFYSFGESDNKNERTAKEMSFVGLKICEDGIVAIADTKASRVNNQGKTFQDPVNPLIKKLFANDNFIVATFGYNEIQTQNNLLRMDQWINANISLYNSPKEFLEGFLEVSRNDNRPFFFMFGCFVNNKYHIINAKIQNNSVTTYQDNISDNLFMGGDQKYIDLFSALELSKLRRVDEAAQVLQKLLESAIYIFTWYKEYNSVGPPITVYTYKK